MLIYTDLAQVVFNIPNGTFKNMNEFKKKFVMGHLQEAKQLTFVDWINDLIVGTGLAGKARTHLITAETQNVTTVEGLISLLDEERSIRQIHLSLQTLDSSKESYDTETSSEEDRKPIVKLRKPVVGAKSCRGGSHTSKRVKKEEAKVKLEGKTKVCYTMLQYIRSYV